MFSTTLFLSALLFVSPLVSAHGTLARVSIDGVVYAGPPTSLSGASPASIVRQVSDVGPVKGATNPDMACGLNAHKPAALVAPAKPGSTVTFQWLDGATPWIHEIGPMLTYMAQCTGTTCDKFDASKAQWFKIDEVGQRPDGTWFQAAIKQGNSLTINLPQSLASGDYLIRHEIIALHNAASVGGAEFYPACTQVRIAGSSNAKVSSPSNLVSFPGGYSDTDSSLVVPDIYNPGFKYNMPGPKLSNVAPAAGKDLITASLAAGDAGSSAQATGSSVQVSSTQAASSATATATQTASAAVKTVTVTVSATACATETEATDGSYKRMVKTRRAGIHGSHASKRSKTSMWAEAQKKAESDEVKRAVAEGEHMRRMSSSRIMRGVKA